ncbi:MAG: nicotinate-nucleotide adenylyltransferase [Syntrophomonadaceae bacterium]
MNSANKLAVIGGTFDPVHYGHLIAAEHARVELGIDKVVFIPSARPPHKANEKVTDWEHRCRMLQLAIEDNPAFEISSLEGPQRGISYTIDTIHSLQKANPERKIYFVMGADALLTIDTWKDYRQLIDLCCFVVVTRPNYTLDRSHPVLAALPEHWWQQMKQVEIPLMDISSTDIRRRVASGKTIRYLLPDAVREYILQNNLYRGGMIS